MLVFKEINRDTTTASRHINAKGMAWILVNDIAYRHGWQNFNKIWRDTTVQTGDAFGCKNTPEHSDHTVIRIQSCVRARCDDLRLQSGANERQWIRAQLSHCARCRAAAQQHQNTGLVCHFVLSEVLFLQCFVNGQIDSRIRYDAQHVRNVATIETG